MLEYISAEQRDLPLLFQLNRQLIDTYEDTSAIDYGRVLAWVRNNLESMLPHFRKILYNGTPAGFFCLHEGELDSLFVLPEFQGRGIGSAVIRQCQAQSPALFLYVFRRNTRAIRLYRHLGFSITQEIGATRYIMEWRNENAENTPL